MDTTGIKRFTIFEGEFALYEASGDTPSSEVFIGGYAEKMAFAGKYGEVLFQYQGDPVEQVRHVSQGYEFEIVNPMGVRVVGAAQAVPSSPIAAFNRNYIFVVAWWDSASGAWIKHSYFGVTLQPARTEGSASGSHGHGGPAMHQTLRFRAQRMAEEVNVGAKPALTIADTGEVRYISGSETVTLYTYSGDRDASVFTPVDPSLLTGRAQMDQAADGLAISIGGTLALHASEDALLVHSFLDGQTFSDSVPRLEFWLNGTRRGSLTQGGQLVALAFMDADSAPADATALRFQDGSGRWLFSLGVAAVAPSLGDTLP